MQRRRSPWLPYEVVGEGAAFNEATTCSAMEKRLNSLSLGYISDDSQPGASSVRGKPRGDILSTGNRVHMMAFRNMF